LGLAKALRWIEASGGSIRLESRPSQGTRSVIVLPGSDGVVSSADHGIVQSRKVVGD
jgi:signal transduction histidine kinase